MVMNHGLRIRTYGISGPVDLPVDESGLAERMIAWLFESCAVGCKDSKLVVRIQATWALGNLLIATLPFRLHLVGPSPPPPPCTVCWLEERFWLDQLRRHVNALTDSEKMFPVAVRALATTLCGLRLHEDAPSPPPPLPYGDTPSLSALLKKLLLKLDFCLLEDLGDVAPPEGKPLAKAIYLDNLMTSNVKRLERVVQLKPQKVVFATTQAIGCIVWAFAHSEQWATERKERVSHWRVVETVAAMVSLMRYGNPNLQLQSLQIVLFFLTESMDGRSGDIEDNSVLTANALLALR